MIALHLIVSAEDIAGVRAAALTILTEWDEFTWLDFDKLAEIMTGKNIVDARNLLDPSIPQRRGFNYRGIGR